METYTPGIAPFVIIALATWRLSHMLAKEDGPWSIFRRLKIRTGAWRDLDLGWQSETALGKLLICPLCMSVWWALVLYVLYIYAPALLPVTTVLAISGAASLLELVSRK